MGKPEPEEETHEPTICCKANTAKCKACSSGMTVKEFCNDAKNKHTKGCEESPATNNMVRDDTPSSPLCCESQSAKCLACASGLTVSEFCKIKENTNIIG